MMNSTRGLTARPASTMCVRLSSAIISHLNSAQERRPRAARQSGQVQSVARKSSIITTSKSRAAPSLIARSPRRVSSAV